MAIFKLLLAVLALLNTNPEIRETLFPKLTPVTMSFVGDCTIATQKGGSGPGTFNRYAMDNPPEYFLEKVAPIFEEDDFTVVNCENVLSDNDLAMTDKGSDTAFWFKGPASSARIFSSSSVEVVGFSNNHANDYGPQGQIDTINALEAEGLTVAKHLTPCYLEKDGFRIGILACRIRWENHEREIYGLLEEMKANSDIQIIYTHGGGEGTHVIDEWRKKGFRDLIDRGADLVICSHPHMLQPVEHYNGGMIVYSLGNFCFGGNSHPENATAIYQVRLLKTPWGIISDDRIIPCRVYTGSVNNYQPCPIAEDDPAYQKIVDYMNGERERPT